MIQAQARPVAELSTPRIPIDQGVAVMPIVGARDRVRTQRAIDALLHGVGSAGARVAILDLTGPVSSSPRGSSPDGGSP